MTESVFDLSQCIEYIYPNAKYSGSLSSSTRDSYELLEWEDERIKPEWNQISQADFEIRKLNKLEEVKSAYEFQLTLGCPTSFNIKLDCAPKDILNWTAALQLLDLAVKIITQKRSEVSFLIRKNMAFQKIMENEGVPREPEMNEILSIPEPSEGMLDAVCTQYGVPEVPTTQTVTDFDNQVHELTVDNFKMICLEVGLYYNSLLGKKWMLREAILASTDINQLVAIGW